MPAFAQSCPSTDGAGYTFVDTGGSANYNIGPGQSLLIMSGTFNGFINAFPSTASICVNPGATLRPTGANNFSGTVENHGATTMQGVNFNSGTTFNNRAGVLTFNGANANGPINIHNATGATFQTVGNVTLTSGSVVVNHGVIETTSNGILEIQSGTHVTNHGAMHMNGNNLNSGGIVENYGYIDDVGELHVNGGSFLNACTVANADRIINGGAMTNSGFFVVSGVGGFFTNNGTLSQEPNAVIAGAEFVNDGTVSGGGSYHFTGSTKNQGPFHGSDPGNPINFYDVTRTPPPVYFDIQNSAPSNVTRMAFTPPTSAQALENCSTSPPEANLSVTKSNGLDEVVAGQDVTYTIVVTNHGPSGATNSVLRDVPESPLVCTSVACTSAGGGAACPATGAGTGQLSISNLLGSGVLLDLPANGTLEFQVSCAVDE